LSRISLSGNASGTGTLTIAAPNTSTDRTLTLPDNTGTIVTTGSSPSFPTTIGVGGATPAASGAGITFPAAVSASSDANTLDDYEEGTWTLEIADATTGGNVSATTADYATYTKIGNQVTINASISNISTAGMTSGNDCVIRGLPFSTLNNSVCAVRLQSITLTELYTIGYVTGSYITLQEIRSNLTDLVVPISDLSSGAADILFTATYQVA
jgi:hypothetical protein